MEFDRQLLTGFRAAIKIQQLQEVHNRCFPVELLRILGSQPFELGNYIDDRHVGWSFAGRGPGFALRLKVAPCCLGRFRRGARLRSRARLRGCGRFGDIRAETELFEDFSKQAHGGSFFGEKYDRLAAESMSPVSDSEGDTSLQTDWIGGQPRGRAGHRGCCWSAPSACHSNTAKVHGEE